MRTDSSIHLVDQPPIARSRTQLAAADLERALERGRGHLLALQQPDGHWCGELEGSTILESEYVLLLCFLGMWDDPRIDKAAEHIRRQQLPDGGWTIYPGGSTDVSTSVEAYFVLKLVGDAPDAPHMSRARAAILAGGGVEAANSFTKLYLALFGQYDWARTPAIPPEILLLPPNPLFHVFAMSSWSRQILVPLSIIWAHKPVRDVPRGGDIPELFGGRRPTPPRRSVSGSWWRRFFLLVDHALKVLERAPVKPARRHALGVAERWLIDRMPMSDGVGAIFPPIVNTVLALVTMGYERDDVLVSGQLKELERLEIDDGETLRVQPCKGPVWDTANALRALQRSGAPRGEALDRGVRWLIDHEVRHPGDWRVNSRRADVGGWYFQYANELNPDCDDTPLVLTTLAHLRTGERELRSRVDAATRRGLAWLMGMQNDDGGWAAFDRRCDVEVLTHVPFADHNAMLDPSCADITGRVLETLGSLGYGRGHRVVDRAVAYLHETQEADGTWYGRWGCNYLYGTWLALQGLAAVGEDMSERRYRRAAEWIRRHQNADGGWGELPHSYADPATKGRGPSTTAQTAWALMGLFAVGDRYSPSVQRGLRYLVDRQRPDGSWRDEHWTGTGFPEVFYLRYDFYDDYFPVMALGAYRGGVGRRGAMRRPGRGRTRRPRMPIHIQADMAHHQLSNRLRGRRRFPFVLMLEPLYTCNLACLGCEVERHTGKLSERLSVDTCLRAVKDSGAPIVSICGGEPTLYPELPELVRHIVARRRHIYLCTNGTFLDTRVFGVIPPQERFTINVHLDGLRETHDFVCDRPGVFDAAVDGIREAKARGYHVTTNTTVFKETDIDEVEELCAFVTGLGVDGILLSPGYQYASVERDIFLTREDTHRKFQRVLSFADRYPVTSTPMFLEFAAGERDYRCSPWSTVTYTPRGWKAPCYLIGKQYIAEWEEFWNGVDWDYWESRKDERCRNCAMHSGFEASVLVELHRRPADVGRLLAWNAGL